jgi:putative transposase
MWATDITYVPMRRGFVYLVAIVDWATRKVLADRVSISMSTDFCIEALEEAIARYGRPEIFNTDQGSQCSSRNNRVYCNWRVRETRLSSVCPQ